MDSNWKYNFYRYGLMNLWEFGSGPYPTLAGVKADAPGFHSVVFRFPDRSSHYLRVPLVDPTNFRIEIVPTFPVEYAWVWNLDGNVYRASPLVLPWQMRIDPN